MNGDVRTVAVVGVGGRATADLFVAVAHDLSFVYACNRDVGPTISVCIFGMNTATEAHSTHVPGGLQASADRDINITVTD